MAFAAAVFGGTSGWVTAARAQVPQDQPTRVEDVVVEGRRVDDIVARFVEEAAAPSHDRGLARWRGTVCVGVVNLAPEVAQGIVDRITDVMTPLGLEPGQPGCRAEVVIIFAADGQALAAELAEDHRRAFRSGIAGLDRGNQALDAFVASDRPIRWWHVSMPVDSETGSRATRLSGDTDMLGNPVSPEIRTMASRLTSQIRDDLIKTLVIVDIDEIGALSGLQLADYLAFVSLAQIDLAGSYSGYDSVLAVFDDPSAAPDGLTDWDLSYLFSLYEALDRPQGRRNPGAATTGAVADEMTRRRLSAPADEDE